MTDQTALVILNPPPTDSARAVAWFEANGFHCDPVVGISFAVTAPEATFRQAFGVPAGPDLPLKGIPVAADLQAVTVTQAPDFGPGNP